MKKLFPLICITAIAFFAFKQTSKFAIGSQITNTNVALKDVSGKDITLAGAMTQKGLLVMFSCNTCPYVRANQARTKEVCSYAQSNGLGVVVLNSNEALRGSEDSYADMQTYAKDQGYNWYYATDNNSVIANAFGADRTPECFLFDNGGKLAYHGAIDDSPMDAGKVSRHYLKTAIDEMNSGKAVSQPETRSVGCVIKKKD